MDSKELRKIANRAAEREAEEERQLEQAKIEKMREERRRESDKAWQMAREAIKNLQSTLRRAAEGGRSYEFVYTTFSNLNVEFHGTMGFMAKLFHPRAAGKS